MGNALSDRDVDALINDAEVKDGKINIAEFARMLKRGAKAE
jgi:Ca2+-binding EF-hand superfamily protein